MYQNAQTLASAAATKANEDAATAPKTAPITSFRDVGNSATSLPPCPVAVIMCRDCRARTAEEEGAAENADPPLTRVATTTEPRIERERCKRRCDQPMKSVPGIPVPLLYIDGAPIEASSHCG